MKKVLIWVLVILLLLSGGGALWYLFHIGAIGFTLPETADPPKTDLLGLYRDAAPVQPQAQTLPAADPSQTVDPTVSTEPTEPSQTADPTNPTEPTEPVDGQDPAEGPRELASRQYFVYDLRDEEFLVLSCDETERIYPASITKLLSCYVALQHMEPGDILTAGSEINMIDWDSSRAYIYEGDTLTLKDCIAGMLLPSGNDAAYVLAANAGRHIAQDAALSPADAIQVFVEEMNTTAKALGMEYSQFRTPDGIHDDRHYTCPKDLAILCKALLDTPLILQTTFRSSIQATVGKDTKTWYNTNFLINPSSKFYIPYAIGLKTGYTDDAGNCLISMYYDDDRLYLIGTFGCATREDRLLDSLDLYRQYILKEE